MSSNPTPRMSGIFNIPLEVLLIAVLAAIAVEVVSLLCGLAVVAMTYAEPPPEVPRWVSSFSHQMSVCAAALVAYWQANR